MAERTRRSRAGAGSTRRGSSAPAEGLDRDYGDEEYREPGEGYQGPTPRKGLYPAKLVRVGNHTSGEGNESVRWVFELTGGTSPTEDGDEESVAGFQDSQYTNDSSTLWREQQIAVALGLVKPNGRLKLSFDGILKKAKPCTVRIIRERYVPEDGEPEWRAKIAAVLSHRDLGKPAAASRRRAKDDTAEDVFDDDTEAEDDEEETPPPPRRSRRAKKAEPEPEPEDEDEEEEEGDEEEDWPEDPDELAAALEELDLAELKTVAKNDFGVTIKRGMKPDAIIDAVLDTLEEADEDEAEEDEPEEEPEPPKRRARGGAAATKTGSTRRKRGSQDPPF